MAQVEKGYGPKGEEIEVKIADAPEKEPEQAEADLASQCRETICPSCDVMHKAEDEKLRALAEADNLRKRLSREMEELRKYAAESVLADLLPVLDNLDLALQHGRDIEACKDFVAGVDMTRKVFLDTLASHGLEATGRAGQEFDPQFHEAVGVTGDQELGDNTVAQVLQNGYVLRGRLLRPAKVMVNKLS